jgi:poly[(R)-3-hydroxyalkanoate] polymerase subunit PhaE
MSKNKKNTVNDINWSDFQKKYFDALMAFNKSDAFNHKPNISADSFWVNAMEDWWKSAKPNSTFANENLFEKVLEQSRSFYFMSEQFSKLIEGLTNIKSNNEDVISFINNKFDEMESVVAANQHYFNWSHLIDACEQPAEMMRKNLSGLPFSFVDMFSDVSPDVNKIRDQYLSIPGVGYSREIQEKIQEAIRLWAIYQDNSQEYQIAMSRLNNNALELMRKKILHMTKNGEDINSMREIYGIWIDSNENVYSDYVLTDEYSELNGRLVNSQMAFKKQSHEITEEILSAMNMPTSKAMNTLERRHYELRKQVRELEAQLKGLQKELKERRMPKAVNKPVKKANQVSPLKKRNKKQTVESKSKGAVSKPKKKKVSSKKTAKKKTRRKTQSKSANQGMIEIKL